MGRDASLVIDPIVKQQGDRKQLLNSLSRPLQSSMNQLIYNNIEQTQREQVMNLIYRQKYIFHLMRNQMLTLKQEIGSMGYSSFYPMKLEESMRASVKMVVEVFIISWLIPIISYRRLWEEARQLLVCKEILFIVRDERYARIMDRFKHQAVVLRQCFEKFSAVFYARIKCESNLLELKLGGTRVYSNEQLKLHFASDFRKVDQRYIQLKVILLMIGINQYNQQHSLKCQRSTPGQAKSEFTINYAIQVRVQVQTFILRQFDRILYHLINYEFARS